MKLENQSSIIVMAYHLGEQRKEKISSIDGLVISLVQSIQKVLLLNHFFISLDLKDFKIIGSKKIQENSRKDNTCGRKNSVY